MKIFNKRPIVLFALVMMATVLAVIYHNFFVLKICFLSFAAVLLIVGTIFLSAIKKDILKYVFSRFVVVALAVFVSLASVEISQVLYTRDYSEYSGSAIVSARICEVGEEYGGNKRRIVLDGVHVEATNLSKDLHSRLSLVVFLDANDPETFVVGKQIDAVCNISFASVDYESENGKTFFYKNKNISAYGFVYENAITVVDESLNLTLQERVQQKVEAILKENLDKEYVGLAQGMLFGDKSSTNEQIYSDFSSSGIAHLMAVSGLHVGFLVALLSFILKLCRVKGIFKFAIISTILAFYAYLCGFTVSVVRASIMAVCLLLAGIRNQKYDSLNALALAFIIIVSISPYSIVTPGFVLSFVCVLSIILLAPIFTRFFKKFLYHKFASTIAVLLAVQIGSMSVSAFVFKHITFTAVVSNFVSIPIASIAYMLLFASVALAFLVPVLGINVYLFEFVMQAVVKFVHLLAPYGLFEILSWKGSALVASQLPAMLVSSDYLFAKKPVKIVLCVGAWAVFLTILFC